MTQNQRIEKHLKAGKSLTALQALEKFGCFRLASRVNDLHKKGLPIQSEMVISRGKRIAKYHL